VHVHVLIRATLCTSGFEINPAIATLGTVILAAAVQYSLVVFAAALSVLVHCSTLLVVCMVCIAVVCNTVHCSDVCGTGTLQRYWLYGAFQYCSYPVRLPGVFFTSRHHYSGEQGNAVPMQYQCGALCCIAVDW
jgi:hypothetical protein